VTIQINVSPHNIDEFHNNSDGRYFFQTNITKDKNKRRKELGYYPSVNKAVKREVRERDNYTCQICGEYGKQIDHIVPLRISHDNSPANLRTLCIKCNNATRLKRRDARLPYDEWIKHIEELLEDGN